MKVSAQREIDAAMIELMGRKTNHGSAQMQFWCFWRLPARARGLKNAVVRVHSLGFDIVEESWRLPVPLMNILNGGRHADTNLDIQEYIIARSG